MTFNKRKTITEDFITTQFSYCPVGHMLHKKSISNKIYALYDTVLKITCGKQTSLLNEMLERITVSIDHANLLALVTVTCKISNDMSPTILSIYRLVKSN